MCGPGHPRAGAHDRRRFPGKGLIRRARSPVDRVFQHTRHRIIVFRCREQQRVSCFDLLPQDLDNRREALSTHILIVERKGRNVGNHNRHTRRFHFDRSAQRRHILRAFAQAAANAEDSNSLSIAHRLFPYDAASCATDDPLSHRRIAGKPLPGSGLCRWTLGSKHRSGKRNAAAPLGGNMTNRIDRRSLLRLSGAGAIAAGSGGLAGILASGRAPAYAQTTSIHWVRWSDFVPSSDKLLREKILPEGEKALGMKIVLETINANDIQARVTSSIQAGTGPDIIMALNNWPQLYATSLTDVSDITEEISRAQGGYYDMCK